MLEYDLDREASAVLVLGMHRSGTSALAGMIEQAGALGPLTPLPPNDANPKGYIESKKIMIFNDRLLAKMNSNWDDPLSSTKALSKNYRLTSKDYRDAADILRSEFLDARLFVLKDPRICRLLPFWTKALAKLEINTLPVLTVRNPLEVASSLRTRDGMSTEHALLLWLRHTLDAEYYSRKIPRSVNTFEDLLSNPTQVIQNIKASFDSDSGLFNPSNSVTDFVSEDLRHERSSVQHLTNSPQTALWVRRCYEAMCQISSAPASEEARSVLDEIREQFDNACLLMRPLLETAYGATNHAKEEAIEAQAQLEASQSHLNALQTQISDLNQKNNALETEFNEAREAAKTRDRLHVEELQAETVKSQSLRGHAEHLQREFDKQERDLLSQLEAAKLNATELTEAKNELKTALQTNEKEYKSALAAERSNVESLDLLIEQLRQSIEALETQSRNDAIQFRSELGSVRDEFTRAKKSNAQMVRRLSWYRAQATHWREKMKALADELVEIQTDQDNAKTATRIEREAANRLQVENKALSSKLARNQQATQQVRALEGRIQTAAIALTERHRRHRLKGMISGHLAKQTIISKGLFEPEFYKSQLKKLGLNPDADLLGHYLRVGEVLGLMPHPLFDPNWYYAQYEDVCEQGHSALIHYCRHGSAEQRRPHLLFDGDIFARSLPAQPDLSKAQLDPIARYWKFATEELTEPHRLFNSNYYIETYPDVKKSGMNPLVHYLRFGSKEYRNPNPSFDEKWYRETYGDQIPEDCSSLEHFLEHGMANDFAINQHMFQMRDVKRTKDAGQSTIIVVAHSASDRIFGSERSLINVLSCIDRSRFRIVLVLPNPSPEYFRKTAPLVDKIVTSRRVWWTKDQPVNVQQIEFFTALIEAEQADLVYSNTIMLRESLIAARDANVPTICHVREIIDQDKDLLKVIGRSSSEIVDEIRSLADYVIANSDATAKLFAKKNRLFTIPNAIDTDKISSRSDRGNGRPLRVGMLSSNIAKKGIRDFYALAKLASKQGREIEFFAYGPKNSETQKIESKLLSDQVDVRLHFPGYTEHPNDALQDVDVVVILSKFAESFGRTAAEAMAAKLPVIAYARGALSEVISHNETGFLVEPDSPSAVLEKLIMLETDPELRLRMGVAGERRAEDQYSLSVLSRNINHALKTALKGEVASPPNIAPSEPERALSPTLEPTESVLPITVVIPNYNYAPYLPDRINSILRQTLRPAEIIFLDDCSTDDSLQVAQNILQEQAGQENGIPYRIIANKQNAGVYRQWLKAFRESKTDWVWIAEADDTCDDDFLEHLADKVDDGINVVYAQSRKIDEFGNLVAPNYLHHTEDLDPDRWRHDFVRSGPQEILKSLAFRNSIPNTSAVIMRKSAVSGIEDTLKSFKYVGDWLLYAHMLRSGGLAFVSKPLNNFRRHTRSVTNSTNNSLPYLIELARIRAFIAEHFPILPRHIEQQNAFLNRDYRIADTEKNSEHPGIAKLLTQADNLTGRRKRVAIITTNNGSHNGGSEMLWQESALALRQNGHDVLVLIKNWQPTPAIVKTLQVAGVRILFKDSDGFNSLIEARPDLTVVSIGDQDEGIEYYPNLVDAGLRYVIVNQLTKEARFWPIREKKQKPVRRGYRNADTVFFTSRNNHRVMESRLGCDLSNGATHFNPYHIDRTIVPAYPSEEDGFQVAIPSKLLFIHKGQDLLLEVLQQSNWKSRNVQFNFYGEGPDRSKIEDAIREHQLNHLHLKGRVDDIAEIWRDNHALLMPSRMEGMPIMVISALLSARTCILTDIGGHAEVVRDNETGFIIPSPEISDVAATLERSYAERANWQAMGQQGRKDILKFLPEDPVADFLEKLEAIWSVDRTVSEIVFAE